MPCSNSASIAGNRVTPSSPPSAEFSCERRGSDVVKVLLTSVASSNPQHPSPSLSLSLMPRVGAPCAL